MVVTVEEAGVVRTVTMAVLMGKVVVVAVAVMMVED